MGYQRHAPVKITSVSRPAMNTLSPSSSSSPESTKCPDDDPPDALISCGSKGPRGPLLLEKLRQRYPDGRNGVAVMMNTNSPKRSGSKRWTIVYSRTKIEWNASEEGKNWAWQGEGMEVSREGGRNTVTFTHMSKPRAARSARPSVDPPVPSGCLSPQGTCLLEALKRTYPNGRNGVGYVWGMRRTGADWSIFDRPKAERLATGLDKSWAWRGKGTQYSIVDGRRITVTLFSCNLLPNNPATDIPSGCRGPHGQLLLEKLREGSPNGRTGVVVMTALDSKGDAKSWRILHSISKFEWDAASRPGKSWAWQGEGMQVSYRRGRNVITFSKRFGL